MVRPPAPFLDAQAVVPANPLTLCIACVLLRFPRLAASPTSSLTLVVTTRTHTHQLSLSVVMGLSCSLHDDSNSARVFPPVFASAVGSRVASTRSWSWCDCELLRGGPAQQHWLSITVCATSVFESLWVSVGCLWVGRHSKLVDTRSQPDGDPGFAVP